MSENQTNRTSKIAAYVLIIVNFLALMVCVLLFGLSLWSISSPTTLAYAVHQIGGLNAKVLFPPDTLTVQSGVGIAILSTFIFIISFMGFYGAITKSQFLLFMYSILVLLLLLLECSLLYYFTSNFIEKGLQEQDGQWTHAMRLAFQCCEYNTSLSEAKPPWSCCGVAGYPDNCTSQVFYKGCQKTITKWLERNLTVIYVSLAVAHIILSSCSILRRVCSGSRSVS